MGTPKYMLYIAKVLGRYHALQGLGFNVWVWTRVHIVPMREGVLKILRNCFRSRSC